VIYSIHRRSGLFRRSRSSRTCLRRAAELTPGKAAHSFSPASSSLVGLSLALSVSRLAVLESVVENASGIHLERNAGRHAKAEAPVSSLTMTRKPTPPVPALKELHQTTPWVWLFCADHQCSHHVATTLAWAVIRYGADASTDVLRKNTRCKQCGKKGALIQLPSWTNMIEGAAPVPTDSAATEPPDSAQVSR
jgi:hypothetical protein